MALSTTSLLVSSILPSSTKLQVKVIKLYKTHPCQVQWCSSLLTRQRIFPTCCLRNLNDQFDKLNEKLHLSSFKEKLSEAVPHSVKDFPWKKAENILLNRLVVVGQKVLKRSIIVLFILSSLSDAVFSISKNRELIIPIGLLAGCIMADFFKEISQEMVLTPEEKDLKLPLVVISCFFMLIKVISTYFQTNLQVFLLQLANGGLMQVLWLWKDLMKQNGEDDSENSTTIQETVISQ